MKRTVIIVCLGLISPLSAQESRGTSRPGRIVNPVKQKTEAARPPVQTPAEPAALQPSKPAKDAGEPAPKSQPSPAAPAFVNVDVNIPVAAAPNPDGIAVIIGNRDYANPDVPDVDYAVPDARTVRQYAVSMLGFAEENIIFIENAKKTDFELNFGTRDVAQGKLFNWVRPGKSDVFVYYSGHGAPDLASGKAYFMPVDSHPDYIRIGGYPLDVFYANLSQTPARSVTVVLDACFSGGSQGGMIIRKASPMFIDVEMPLTVPGALLASSSGDQISHWFPRGGHSLFTYFYLRGMRGDADLNRDRKVSLEEMKGYLGENVSYAARRLYNREQTPVVKGDPDKILCVY